MSKVKAKLVSTLLNDLHELLAVRRENSASALNRCVTALDNPGIVDVAYTLYRTYAMLLDQTGRLRVSVPTDVPDTLSLEPLVKAVTQLEAGNQGFSMVAEALDLLTKLFDTLQPAPVFTPVPDPDPALGTAFDQALQEVDKEGEESGDKRA